MLDEKVVKDFMKAQVDFITKLEHITLREAEIIEQSELRIDRINSMVVNLTDAVDKLVAHQGALTEIYDRHLSELILSRNELAKQNTIILQMFDRMTGVGANVNITK